MKYENITGQIIHIFYKVYNSLGYGFLEKVYENAMIIEFQKLNLNYENQYPINVYYEGFEIGHFIADFIVEEKVLIELKAIRELSSSDESQLINYLNATSVEVGLLLNFGKSPEIKRKIFDNQLKKYNQDQ